MRFLSPPEIPVLASPPASPGEGEMYYDSTEDRLRVWDGTEWKDHHSGSAPIFIGDTAPTTDAPTYLWIETGLGPGGDGLTFWIEDGTV